MICQVVDPGAKRFAIPKIHHHFIKMIIDLISFPTKRRVAFFKKFLLNRGPFCRATGTLCFGPWILPLSFKARVDPLSPALFCYVCTTIPWAISGCPERVSNPDRPPLSVLASSTEFSQLSRIMGK